MAIREINFVPPDLLARSRMKRHFIFWSGCMLLSLLLIAGVSFFHSQVILAKKRSLSATTDIPLKLNSRAAEIRQVQEELKLLGRQQSIIEAISKQPSCSAIIAQLADRMNDSLWLTQLSVEAKDGEDRSLLKLTGFSLSQDSLGDFLNRLAMEPAFRDVNLKYSREGDPGPSGGRARLIQFQIECTALRG